MNKLNFAFSIILSLSLISCVNENPNLDIKHSAVKLRQFQKREFKVKNHLELTKTVIGALQDWGLTVKNVNSDIGIINAEMQISDSSAFSQYMQSWLFRETTIASVKHWDATINIDKLDDIYVVRANFVAKALNKVGGIIKAEPITDPKFYQDFFELIDKALFLKQNKL